MSSSNGRQMATSAVHKACQALQSTVPEAACVFVELFRCTVASFEVSDGSAWMWWEMRVSGPSAFYSQASRFPIISGTPPGFPTPTLPYVHLSPPLTHLRPPPP